MKNVYLLFLLAFPFSLFAQQKEFSWVKKDSLFKYVQPLASMQFWTTYTMGEKAKLYNEGPLEPVQDRLNFFARRARVGFKESLINH